MTGREHLQHQSSIHTPEVKVDQTKEEGRRRRREAKIDEDKMMIET